MQVGWRRAFVSQVQVTGQERKKCTTPQCARCEQWGHLICEARTLKALRWGSPSTPLQAEAVLGGNHAVQCAAQVEPPTVVSAEVQGAKISDKEEQEKMVQAAPGEAKVQNSGEKEPRSVEALLTTSQRSVLSADTPVQAPKPVEVQKKQEGAHPSNSKMAAQPAAPSPLVEKALSTPVVKGRGRSSRSRKHCGSLAWAAVAARKLNFHVRI
ncbi:hypothetical protein HPB51_004220 [Rhipicephalus microplus]|uniref:Uncharacterized protein n=1 Tax=Rhipicephalus microplus TaxID=6941 RepID=A0A9J6DZ80_RHIMP|nr:hypothetical protein HPB51_004220 [Rhipicephalus microplus]